jgi:ectoine hydroxylase-related dioxygenase (phytanoyl-CoA dioxygenase family)
MTPEQRYVFDATGYLHIKNVLSEEELLKAQEAADRYIDTPHDEIPDGFRYMETDAFHHHDRGFAFDKALERLLTHKATWPIIRELTANKPGLLRGSLMLDAHDCGYLYLHSIREQMLEGNGVSRDIHWTQPYSDTIYCDFFNVFWYFDDVRPGDGGLLLIPGSHKSKLKWPEGITETMVENNYEYEKCCVDDSFPFGLVNITPKAGDVVIASDQIVHGALKWKPKDRARRFLVLRYAPQYMLAWTNERDVDLPPEILERLSPETRELLSKEYINHTKEIADRPHVTLS